MIVLMLLAALTLVPAIFSLLGTRLFWPTQPRPPKVGHRTRSERLGATPEQVFVNLHKYGNTSAASVAIALDDAAQSGRIERGDLVLLIVFGAGLTWGAAVIEW